MLKFVTVTPKIWTSIRERSSSRSLSGIRETLNVVLSQFDLVAPAIFF